VEKEKLLQFLKIIGRIFFLLALLKASYSWASENINFTSEDRKWAEDLSDQAINMVWEDLAGKFNQQQQLEEDNKIITGSKPARRQTSGLYIFVSSSMPKSLLKSYLSEAAHYKGVLVLKGLPNSSFKELTKLVVELSDDPKAGDHGNIDLPAGFQIDDQAFEEFLVTNVPCVVLVKAQNYIANQTNIPIFDKITGNLGIKYALEQFSSSGELASQATEHLHYALTARGENAQ
jgi:type-F conjugative transfer system pilin assembly protein TrbC